MQLRILTLNLWGVRYLAKLVDQRIQAFVKHLLDTDINYDIIGLQEVNLSLRTFRFQKFFSYRFGAKQIICTYVNRSRISTRIVTIF